MNFRDLKLPKELSKKKKLDLYKCWILTPLVKGSDERVLDLNWDCDRYGLSEKAAVAVELNNLGADNLVGKDILEMFNGKCFVIMRVTLIAGTMDEDIVLPAKHREVIDIDPHYDPIIGALNVTVHGRIADMEMKNYTLTDISLEIDDNTHIVNVLNIEMQEQIINHAVTGGR